MNNDGHAFTRTVMLDLQADEGFRQFPYYCSEGALTIGYGRNLDVNGISEAEADILLRNDIVTAREYLRRIVRMDKLSDNRLRALINMMFNLGPGRFKTFKKMIQAIEDEDFERASVEMLDSVWASQVGARAVRLAKIIKEG